MTAWHVADGMKESLAEGQRVPQGKCLTQYPQATLPPSPSSGLGVILYNNGEFSDLSTRGTEEGRVKGLHESTNAERQPAVQDRSLMPARLDGAALRQAVRRFFFFERDKWL